MKSLYRRYRPMRLEDVVGQEQVTNVLLKSLAQNRISHAYLFIGPRGTGKTSVARIFAHAVNKFDYELEDDYIDIIEIDGASNRGIDNIRELREKVTIAPTKGKYKVYIIDEVHMLTKEAFNALLKTLEEPPEHAIFIMATTDAYKVPITITSRAQTYTFKLASHDVMFNYLKSVAEKEKVKIADAALDIIVRRGGGSFRDSLSLFDQISTLSEGEITKDLVVQAMGLPEDEKIEQLLTAYINSDATSTVELLKELFMTGINPETAAEEMIAQIIANPQPKLLHLLEKLPEVKAPFAEAKLLVALANDTVMPAPSVAAPQVNPVASKSTPKFTPAAINTAPAPMKQTPETPSIFNWENFLNRMKKENEALYLQLLKTKHELVGDELNIYPRLKTTKNILMKDKNLQLMRSAVNGVKITIHEIADSPVNEQKDELISKLSAIMGGEVTNDGGGNPFN